MTKSQWLAKLDLLKSIDLTMVAEEVTRKRERKVTGDLPRDKRANAIRMKRAIIAMHEIVSHSQTWICTVERIADQMHVAERTARRAVIDLEDACLIEVTRRERARRKGGQGPNQYLIVWSNLKNIALDQGFQGFLFPEFDDSEAVEDATAGAMIEEPDRPETPSGSHHTARGRAPGHSGRAPGHSGRAPGHSGRALRNARARVSFPLSSSFSPPLSFSGREEGEEVWNLLTARILAYGVTNIRQPLQEAVSRGWTVAQINALLDRCERESVGTIRAYGPGAIFCHLRLAEPGAPITLPPSEEYLRAKRDRDRRHELAQQAKRTAPKRPNRSLERGWGEALDALNTEETKQLLESVELTDFERAEAVRQAFAEPGQRFGYTRPKLLVFLAAQLQEEPDA